MRGDALLRASALRIGHGGRPLPLPALDLTLRPGRLYGLVGRNGAGKSTLLTTLAGLRRPVAGRIELTPDLRRLYLAQRAAARVPYFVTAGEVCAWGGLHRFRWWPPHRPGREAVAAALTAVGLAPEIVHRRFRDLSVGQQQRVLLARAIVAAAELLFLDEPTAAMDVDGERRTLELVRRLTRERHTTAVVVTHNRSLVRELADVEIELDPDRGAVHVVPLAARSNHEQEEVRR